MKSSGIFNGIPDQISQLLETVEELFEDQLIGVYLYGSAILGHLQVHSDIDILVLVDGHMPEGTRTGLTKRLMLLSGRVGCGGKRPLEVTVVNRGDVVPWRFPPKYEYMYGEWLREQLELGFIPQASRDPDLAILLWQARSGSLPLKGPGIMELIEPVPEKDIRQAIKDSLPGLVSGLEGDERNVLLTLARMWFTVCTGKICSKDKAAEWAIPQTPPQSAVLLETARKAYLGECEDHWDHPDAAVTALAAFLRRSIEERGEQNPH